MASTPIVSRTMIALVVASISGCTVYANPSTSPVPAPPAPGGVITASYSGSSAGARIDVGYFYDALDPDGDWLYFEPYGWVWAPNAVDPFWRPYTVGRWEWTDWGWTWVSAERWGWATYHYGRWVRANRYGWVWIPGDTWGPAWVAWRSGPGVVGWAPLPPQATFRAGFGLDWGGGSLDVAIRSDGWCFVDEDRLVDLDVHRYAYPVGRNATIVRTTRDITRVRVVDRRIVNEGIDRDEIARVTRRSIPALRVVDAPRAEPRAPEVHGSDVSVFRPSVDPTRRRAAPTHGIKPAAPPADDRDLGRLPQPGSTAHAGDEAERRWNQRWSEDRRRLEEAQRRPTSGAPLSPPKQDATSQHREEQAAAEENARRELVAERERVQRRADRANRKAVPPGQQAERVKKDKKNKQNEPERND